MRGNQIKQIFLQKWRFLDLTFKLKKFLKKPRIFLKKLNFYLKKFHIFRIGNLNQEIAIFRIFLFKVLNMLSDLLNL